MKVLKYNPSKLINGKLETSEEHLHSFQITPYHKTLFIHKPSFELYTIHLTNIRVIIEPAINNINDFLIPLCVTGTLVSPHHAHHMLHKLVELNHAKEKMAMLKYTYVSIPYKDIQAFEMVKVAFNVNLVGILIKPESKILNLEIFKELEIKVFKPSPVIGSYENRKYLSEKGWGNIFSEAIQSVKELGRVSEEFIEIANRLLLT